MFSTTMTFDVPIYRNPTSTPRSVVCSYEVESKDEDILTWKRNQGTGVHYYTYRVEDNELFWNSGGFIHLISIINSIEEWHHFIGGGDLYQYVVVLQYQQSQQKNY